MSLTGRVSCLLFGSGLCALIYQTVWLREFRLIFGASTAASAAVLAIFMAGLGIGGLLLGKRVDTSKDPLGYYGRLEILIPLSAAVSPLLLWLVRALYLATGGSFTLGDAPAAILRLVLSTLVIGIPTFLMGGTLPAAARAVELSEDRSRRRTAVLYAVNAAGAVAGVLISTFFLLETFGNQFTLWMAALLNIMIGLAAILMSRSGFVLKEMVEAEEEEESEQAPALSTLRRRFIYAAAAVTGFAFLLMELVWFRVLTPLLGGTTFTFGLILAAALLGIGVGSFAYSTFGRNAPTLRLFGLWAALEALFIVIPFALGDRIASLALFLRPLGIFGFMGYVGGWAFITFIVVFPAAFVSGIQFPMLIGLLGRGRRAVGRHVGVAYAWNTVGTISGSIAGGFGFLPLLTASGTWRVAVIVLLVIALFAVLLSLFEREQFGASIIATVPVALAAGLLLFADGPTAFWRHTPIGAGRVETAELNRNGLQNLINGRKRTTLWESEGVETSVSLSREDGLAFIVNGKSDGHTRYDAATQVMGGILGGILHPAPKHSMVVGLGTGTTAGWLAAIPTMESVDVVEIEPSIRYVAELSGPVNHGALQNPKLHLYFGDGREFLLTAKKKYDIISSEPSNPYRAGIASLFTRNFYQACAPKLAEGGLFLQFLQAYEIDAETLRTIYATLTSVFPVVETWQTQHGDLLLVAANQPIAMDATKLQQIILAEPYRSALWNVWRVDSIDGLLSRYVSGTKTARSIGRGAPLNTDDRTIIEYGFARTLGQFRSFNLEELRDAARLMDDAAPNIPISPEQIESMEDHRLSLYLIQEVPPFIPASATPQRRLRGLAQERYMAGNYAESVRFWTAQDRPPLNHVELVSFAESLADAGDERAMPYISRVGESEPIEGQVLLARLWWKQERFAEAAEMLRRAFEGYRTNPWPLPVVMHRSLDVAVGVAADDPSGEAPLELYRALSEPFALYLSEERRLGALLAIADRLPEGPCNSRYVEILSGFEPHIPWQEAFLASRSECYQRVNSPLAADAAEDLRKFRSRQPRSLTPGIR